MFGFLTSGAKEVADPLLSAKSVSGWLRQLPALDVIGRQQHVMRAFDAMRQSRKPVDLGARAGASSSSTPRWAPTAASSSSSTSRTTTPPPSSPNASGRRSTISSQGFIYAYQTALEEALRAGQQRPLEAADAAAVRAARPLLRHGRQAPRVPVRALDPREVDGTAPHVPARVRARRRPRDDGARERRAQRHAVDGRAGIPLRPADPPAQHRQHVAAAARLGHVAAARMEPQAAARRRAAVARGLLRRRRRQDGPRAPHGQRLRIDAALPRHHAARRLARARGPGAAAGGVDRPGSRRADQPAARRDPGKGESRRSRPT